MKIADKILQLKKEIPGHVKLVAVSKTKPNEYILEACKSGHLIFGENRIQDLVIKQETLPKDIQWHFIGHLQTNKVKYIAPFISMIEGVDSLKLLMEINKQGKKNDRTINCLLQFHIATEESKFGLDISEAKTLMSSDQYKSLEHIKICGVMGMATYTDNIATIRSEFKHLKSIFNQLKTEYFSTQADFKEISMGMSGDYKIAIEEGSTMVRIGSLIFGERN
jgi:hypothetical protein